jgi:hypothetical protein
MYITSSWTWNNESTCSTVIPHLNFVLTTLFTVPASSFMTLLEPLQSCLYFIFWIM